MPIFSYNCKKVKIEIFDDKIVLYPTLNGKTEKNAPDLHAMRIHYPEAFLTCTYAGARTEILSLDPSWSMKINLIPGNQERILDVVTGYGWVTALERAKIMTDCITTMANFYPLVKGNHSKLNLLMELKEIINSLHEKKKESSNPFIGPLEQMTIKAMALALKAEKSEKYSEAAVAATILCQELHIALTRDTPEEFSTSCKNACDTARKVLEKHRELKGEVAEFLANLGLFCLLAGVGYIGYGIYNVVHNQDRFMFFRLKPESIEYLEKVEEQTFHH